MLQHRHVDHVARGAAGPFGETLADTADLARILDQRQARADRRGAADGDIGRRGHRQPRGREAEDQPIGLLAHHQMLALAHNVADIAEHEEVAGNRAGERSDIIGGAGHKAGGETLRKMRRGILLRDRIADATRGVVIHGDIVVTGKLNEAVSQIGVTAPERSFDIVGEQRRVISHSRTDLQIRERGRVVLGCERATRLARMRSHCGKQRATYCHTD